MKAPPAPPPVNPRDPADMMREMLAKMARQGGFALEELAAGHNDKALSATLAMQSVMFGGRETLAQAFYAGKSKRVPPDTRKRVNEAFDEGVAPLNELVRRLGVALKAARARQAAISAALNANAPKAGGGVYTARGRMAGARLGMTAPYPVPMPGARAGLAISV